MSASLEIMERNGPALRKQPGPWPNPLRGSDMPKSTPTVEQRFWSKVVRDPETDCWEWVAGASSWGYGRFWNGKRYVQAHRWAYEHLVGPIPEGLVTDHICRNPACVNPAHLEAVTQQVNTLRGVGPAAKNAAKTHCKNGHEYTPENTYPEPKGRGCRQCRRMWERNRLSRYVRREARDE